ncbi:MAG: hypothetical protein IJZ44_07765 [Lachnospiraceae bacterium]|nr:hypothetical protein [Lachnospiraceae bacterium]
MAKKVRNLILLGAAIGAAAAGTYYYLKKKDNDFYDEEDEEEEDFDAFEEDDDLNAVTGKVAERNYVPLSFDAASETDETPTKDVTLDDMESVEEFFDEEDDEISDDTPIEEE